MQRRPTVGPGSQCPPFGNVSPEQFPNWVRVQWAGETLTLLRVEPNINERERLKVDGKEIGGVRAARVFCERPVCRQCSCSRLQPLVASITARVLSCPRWLMVMVQAWKSKRVC